MPETKFNADYGQQYTINLVKISQGFKPDQKCFDLKESTRKPGRYFWQCGTLTGPVSSRINGEDNPQKAWETIHKAVLEEPHKVLVTEMTVPDNSDPTKKVTMLCMHMRTDRAKTVDTI